MMDTKGAGEARVAAELMRAGATVAKPYLPDEACDLLILAPEGGSVWPVPVVVETVQVVPPEGAARHVRWLERLKKAYVEHHPELCLAIYRPDTDEVWFIDGAFNIQQVYEAQTRQHAGLRRYAELLGAEEVLIALDEAAENLADFRVPRDDAAWMSRRLKRLAEKRVVSNREGMHREHDPGAMAVEVSAPDVFDLIAAMPPGTRTKEDIDRQIAEERASWDDR